MAGTGAHLYDTGHKTPAVGKPTGDGGQGDDVDGTEPHSENDAVKKVKFPEGSEAGHQDTAQAQQNGCSDKITLASQSTDEILGKRIGILATEEEMLLLDATFAARTHDLIMDIGDACWCVFHRKRFSQNIPMPVAKHHQVIMLGEIHRHAHHL